MSELIYRGINYKFQKQNQQKDPVDKCGAKKAQSFNKLISIKPLQYYTYRGVSYTKTIVFDLQHQVLLDIDRQ